MITLGKKNTLHTRRQALEFITKEDVVTKVFAEIAPKYAERNGGYTRIMKVGPRRGDAAEMAILVLVYFNKQNPFSGSVWSRYYFWLLYQSKKNDGEGSGEAQTGREVCPADK